MPYNNGTRAFWDAETTGPQHLITMGNRHFQWLQVQGYAPYTIEQRRYRLKFFVQFCLERGIDSVNRVTRSLIDEYQRYLYRLVRVGDGRPYASSYRSLHLTTLVVFFQWLTQRNHILYNPAGAIDMPKIPQKIPHQVLTVPEVERILAQPDIDTAIGLRDRALLETLYSTGIRRCELGRLKLEHICFGRGTLLVVKGKRGKSRVIPIGERALSWIERYLEQRPALLRDETDTLFVTRHGNPFHPVALSRLVAQYIRAAGLGRIGSCHLFRHTMATLMLENGAGIRYVQQMLGHSSIATTQRYTRVTILQLKQVHTRTHPARLSPSQTAQIIRELGDAASR